jgi:putative ABC transport system permease protein
LGIFIEISAISLHELWLIVIVCAAGIVIGLIPGYRIYRYSLADGMTIRI